MKPENEMKLINIIEELIAQSKNPAKREKMANKLSEILNDEGYTYAWRKFGLNKK